MVGFLMSQIELQYTPRPVLHPKETSVLQAHRCICIVYCFIIIIVIVNFWQLWVTLRVVVV